MTSPVLHQPVHLDGLRPITFQHPSDRAILSKLEAFPILPDIVGKALDVYKEQLEIALISSSFHVTEKSLPKIYEVYRLACNTLCVNNPPPLYLTHNPAYDAYTMGVDQAFIVVSSGMADDFNDDELLYILGHELGHFLCKHIKYKTFLFLLAGNTVTSLPGIAKIMANVTFAPLLYLWSRRSEFSCDRAGLLACQSLETAHRVNLRLSGCSKRIFDQLSPNALLDQTNEFRKRVSKNWISHFFATANQLYSTHPRTIERSVELQDWITEGWYDEIVKGTPQSRTKLAEIFSGDPQTIELTLILTRSISTICVQEFQLPQETVMPIIRKILYEQGTLKETPLEKILRIELVIEKINSNTVHYTLVFLINKQGTAVRQKFNFPMPENWDDAPSSVRNEFVKKNENTFVQLLYSV
ncbi:MAG: M48 family metallopeptidase [Planctomycetaceae bacterium]|jgi:Zn-dependent protease with chaperone function|nr:M48 family metallopeptidase [Planctomycetaceae bacterium]